MEGFYFASLPIEIIGLLTILFLTKLLFIIPIIGIIYGNFIQKYYRSIVQPKTAADIAFYSGLVISAILTAILVYFFIVKDFHTTTCFIFCVGYEIVVLSVILIFLLSIGSVRTGMFLDNYLRDKKTRH